MTSTSTAGHSDTNPLVLPAAGLAAILRRNGPCYMESSFLFFSNPPAVYQPPAVPSVRPRGHTTQRARGEIFKLSLFYLRLL